MTRRRLRTWAKWACTLISVVFMCLWVACSLRGLVWYSASGPSAWVYLGEGRLGWGTAEGPGLAAGRHRVDRHRMILSPSFVDRPGLWGAWIPLWWALVASALPAWTLWRGELTGRRRMAERLCLICGYERSGLASPMDKCPECGTAPARG
jgi:hypothetical protein